MDRKNKKAAQLAANGGGGGGSSSSGPSSSARSGGRNGSGRSGSTAGNGDAQRPRSSLLGLGAGTTAPTRRISSRPPGLTAAALSPPAPAPPLQDTEFILSRLDEASKLATAPAIAQTSSSKDDELEVAVEYPPEDVQDMASSPPAAPIPVGNARRPSSGAPPRPDFGPIGSPSRMSGIGRALSNNGGQTLSPGTSPSTNMAPVSSSPFSAPGTQTTFGLPAPPARSGIAASLGATRAWHTELNTGGAGGPASYAPPSALLSEENALEEDDLEEFVPGSLSELLTPEERSRRLSRTSSQRPTMSGLSNAPNTGGVPAPPRPAGVEALHHKYSRSVPGPALLGDLKAIWGDGGAQGVPASPGGGLGNGTPSSFKSGFGGRAEDAGAFSPVGHHALLSPTNASAAFLPGLHQHYSAARGGRSGPAPTGIRNVSGQHALPAAQGGMGLPGSLGANALLGMHSAGQGGTGSTALGGSALSPPRTGVFGGPSRTPFDMGAGTLGAAGLGLDARQSGGGTALSPSALALQAHAPGQSLPQGLAAGYSRIHAQPPPPNLPSPAGAGVGYTEWLASSGGGDAVGSPGKSYSGGGGLDAAFSRMAFTAATSRVGQSALPQQMSRTTSGGVPRASGWTNGAQQPLSPLARPVPTGDDDDLFSMDH
jgi:hypothetical protein